MNNKIKKNKILEKKAAALRYNKDMTAPILSAKGSGYVAQNIIEKSKELNIPIYFNDELLSTLMNLSVGDEIPEQLYEIVANILQYIEKLDV